MNPNQKLSIGLFSDCNFLAVNLLENLLSKNCVVSVVTNEEELWNERTTNLRVKGRYKIINKKVFFGPQPFDYVIYCCGFINHKKAYAEFFQYLSNIETVSPKTIVLFPLESFSGETSNISIGDGSAVIFVGDLLGPRIDLGSSLLIPQLIVQSMIRREMKVAYGENIYPLFVADAVKTISKWLFSFGPYGKVTFLLGEGRPVENLWKEVLRFIKNVRLVYDKKLSPRAIPRGYETKLVNGFLDFQVGETLRWLAAHPTKIEIRSEHKTTSKKLNIPRKEFRHLKIIAGFVAGILILPFVSLLISSILFYSAYRTFKSGNENLALNFVLASKMFSVLSSEESRALKYLPLMGPLYKETFFVGQVGATASDAAANLVPVIDYSNQLMGLALGSDIFDPTQLSGKISQGLKKLHTSTSLLSSQVNLANRQKLYLAKVLVQKVDFARLDELVVQGSHIADNLPSILGTGTPKTYLILFENNMELRPTGGFIGSYGIATLDNGHMSDLTVSDVYSADGQLNGHVEPPAPIKKYLGEANWWLRDSNWDPDFSTSALRAEWFLDKEVGRTVDGVISIDLEPIKQLLQYTGPIFLPDYNLDITSNNLYEKSQAEVQNNFFPGARNKESFLTALSRSLLTNVPKISSNQKLSLLKTIYDGFEGRHLQVYLHNDNVQNSISQIGWDGNVSIPTCGKGCYPDTVGIVEANLGVNKANYFISRNINLNVGVADDKIDRILTLSISNSANPSLGPSGKYKDYLRLLIPDDSNLFKVEGVIENGTQTLTPDISENGGRKEVGILLEVLPGDTKTVRFYWGSSLSSPISGYGIYVRKQAGTGSDPISINLSSTRKFRIADPLFNLTKTGDYVYNTTLARDIFSRFSF